MKTGRIGLGLVAAGFLALAPNAGSAATPFDGVYKGGSSLSGGPPRCQPGSNFNLVVKDGSFLWVFGNERTQVRVAADGSFTGQDGSRFVSGRIVDGRLTASTTGGAAGCNYTWTLTR